MNSPLDHYDNADCGISDAKVLAKMLTARILNDLSVGDDIDRDLLDALAVLSATMEEKLAAIEKAVDGMWQDQRKPVTTSETTAALCGGKSVGGSWQVTEKGMAKRLLICLDEMYRSMCKVANAESTIVEMLPKDTDTWANREYAFKFVAESVSLHTDEFGTWLREARDALETRGWKEEPAG